VLLFERRKWKAVMPSLAIVLLFVALHLFAVRLPHDGPYALTLGWGLVGNLGHYWAIVLGPQMYYLTHGGNLSITRYGTFLLSAAILLWLASCARHKRWIPLFGLLWFVIALAPTLPLLSHVTPYYTFLPSIGLAWLAGDAVVRAAAWPTRLLAIACIAGYCLCEVPSTIWLRDWSLERSRDVLRRESRLEQQVREIRQVQPGGAIFLAGIDTEQFWWGLCYGELYRQGFSDLHVLPDAGERGIAIPPKEWCYREDFQLPREETARLLATGRGHTYDVARSPPKLVAFDERF
jgi:hypothetical protein